MFWVFWIAFLRQVSCSVSQAYNLPAWSLPDTGIVSIHCTWLTSSKVGPEECGRGGHELDCFRKYLSSMLLPPQQACGRPSVLYIILAIGFLYHSEAFPWPTCSYVRTFVAVQVIRSLLSAYGKNRAWKSWIPLLCTLLSVSNTVGPGTE